MSNSFKSPDNFKLNLREIKLNKGYRRQIQDNLDTLQKVTERMKTK